MSEARPWRRWSLIVLSAGMLLSVFALWPHQHQVPEGVVSGRVPDDQHAAGPHSLSVEVAREPIEAGAKAAASTRDCRLVVTVYRSLTGELFPDASVSCWLEVAGSLPSVDTGITDDRGRAIFAYPTGSTVRVLAGKHVSPALYLEGDREYSCALAVCSTVEVQVFRQSGEAAAGASLLVREQVSGERLLRSTVTCDHAGRAVLPHCTEGTYVRALCEAPAEFSREIRAMAGESAGSGPRCLELRCLRRDATLAGRVVTAESGKALGGHEVRAYFGRPEYVGGILSVWTYEEVASTDHEGCFVLSELCPGVHSVSVSGPWGRVEREVLVGLPHTEVELQVGRGVLLSGQVRDSQAVPVSGAIVCAGWGIGATTAVTDRSGEYRMQIRPEDCADKPLLLHARHPVLGRDVHELSLGGEREVTWDASLRLSTVATVTIPSAGAPDQYLSLSAHGISRRFMTEVPLRVTGDQASGWRVHCVANESVELRLEDVYGRVVAVATGSVPMWGRHFELEPSRGSATVQGQIFEPDGRPAAYGWARLMRQNEVYYSAFIGGDDGRFCFRGLEEGSYQLLYSNRTGATVGQGPELLVRGGEHHDVGALGLTGGGVIAGRIVGQDAVLAGSVVVVVMSPADLPLQLVCHDGGYRSSALDPGRYRVWVIGDYELVGEPESIDIVGGERVHLDLAVRRRQR